MGVVYAARDERLDRTVAIKTIRGDRDETARMRLWREARAAAAISHPNICQLYEVEETGDGLVLAMELLAGEPLGVRLGRGPLTLDDTATVSLQTLDALGALHARGLIHRDLKPSNLFLTPHGVKLLDFGLARPMETQLKEDTAALVTMAGAIVGTPNYMAPEQVRGEALDGRADLFSMAALIFEMLSGQMAFAGKTMVDVLHAVLHEQPPALSGGPGVAGLDRLVHRALQKNPDDRYPSAAAMSDAIRGVMATRDSGEFAGPAPRAMTRLIALPFRVLRPDPETDFLSFSLPDAIGTTLAGTPNLLVRSSAAAAKFDPQAPDLRRLAADADVDVALIGSILRAGDQLRATAQLVETPAGTVMWSHSAQHPLQDVFALQDELVGGIVASLSRSFGDTGPRSGVKVDAPRNPAAYELYLRANELSRDWERLTEARDLYRQCLDLDPGFAPAWARLGRCYRVLGKYFGSEADAIESEHAFQRALALSPDLPVLHKYYAQLECDDGRAIDAMRRLLRRARVAVDPEHFAGLVHACRYAGLLEASVAAHEEARRLDPTISTSVTNSFFLMGDFERVLREAPVNDSDLVSMALYRLGRKAEALAKWRPVPADGPSMAKDWDEVMVACLSDAPGARELAERATERNAWKDPEGHMFNATILAWMGSNEQSLRLLRMAVENGFHVPDALLSDAWLAPLRTDPRFNEIVKLAQLRRREALDVFQAEGGERLLGVRAA
jgi:serine/threonine protein kinase/tetratricopeptide (TPR) repeat protein